MKLGACSWGKRRGGREELRPRVEDWEANLNREDMRNAETWGERRRKCERPSVGKCLWKEGRTVSASWVFGGYAQEEGNAEEEGSAEGGGGVREEGFADEQPNTYEF